MKKYLCMLHALFIPPTIGSRHGIDAYPDLIRLDSVLSIGIQIRTDDTNIVGSRSNESSTLTWLKIRILFSKCTRHIGENRRQPHHTKIVYFLITDSASLRD
jgi:hypothetical protein